MASGGFTNRFEPLSDGWQTQQRGKRARHSTGGGSCSEGGPSQHMDRQPAQVNVDELKKLPMDEKLNVILEGMSHLGLINCRIDRLESNMYVNCAANEVADQRLRLLEYRSIDNEVKARETNIIISGVLESVDEVCAGKVSEILRQNMGVDAHEFHIVMAQRLGRSIRTQSLHREPRPRLILVSFAIASK